MGFNLCTVFSGQLLTAEIMNGLFFGALAAFGLFVVFSRTTRISGVPTHLLFDCFLTSIFSTLLRLLVLVIPTAIAAALLWRLGKWGPWINATQSLLACPRKTLPHPAVLLGVPIAGLLFIKYLVCVWFLDSRLGLAIKPWHPRSGKERLTPAGKASFLATEIRLLERTLFASSSDSRLKIPVVYGGFLVRPRVVFPLGMTERLGFATLIRELVHLRRHDAFFETFLRAMRWLPGGRFLGDWHSRWCDYLCDAEVQQRSNLVSQLRFKPRRRVQQWLAAGLFLLLAGWSGHNLRQAWLYHQKYVRIGNHP